MVQMYTNADGRRRIRAPGRERGGGGALRYTQYKILRKFTIPP